METYKQARLSGSDEENHEARLASIASQLFQAPIIVLALPEPYSKHPFFYGIQPEAAKRVLNRYMEGSEAGRLIVVEDTGEELRSMDVVDAGEAGVRFFAGCTSASSDAEPSGGMIAIMDTEPRAFSEAMRHTLEDFAALLNVYNRLEPDRSAGLRDGRWRMLLEDCHEAVCILRDETFIYANQAAADLLGVQSGQDIIGRNPLDLVKEEQTGLFKARQVEVGQGGVLPFVEYEILTPNGERRIIESLLAPVLVDDEPANIAMIRDVTERVEAQRELVRARENAETLLRTKSSFLARMSHEIRTPLTSIIGFSEVLSEETTGQNREFVDLINKSGHHLLTTLNSVLDLARIEAGGIHFKTEDFDLADQINDVLTLFQAKAQQQGTRLEHSTAYSAQEVTLDRAALGRVLFNLISNAIKFTREGTVTVSVEGDADTVQICVADTGIGIAPDFMPYLFEEFRQESGTLAREQEGSGLGLSISKRLIDMMGGRISVASEKGKGTEFRVTLPRRQMHVEVP